jgi:hypothetical protein
MEDSNMDLLMDVASTDTDQSPLSSYYSFNVQKIIIMSDHGECAQYKREHRSVTHSVDISRWLLQCASTKF